MHRNPDRHFHSPFLSFEPKLSKKDRDRISNLYKDVSYSPHCYDLILLFLGATNDPYPYVT